MWRHVNLWKSFMSGPTVALLVICLNSRAHLSTKFEIQWNFRDVIRVEVYTCAFICKLENWIKYLGYRVTRVTFLFNMTENMSDNRPHGGGLFVWWMFCEGCPKTVWVEDELHAKQDAFAPSVLAELTTIDQSFVWNCEAEASLRLQRWREKWGSAVRGLSNNQTNTVIIWTIKGLAYRECNNPTAFDLKRCSWICIFKSLTSPKPSERHKEVNFGVMLIFWSNAFLQQTCSFGLVGNVYPPQSRSLSTFWLSHIWACLNSWLPGGRN